MRGELKNINLKKNSTLALEHKFIIWLGASVFLGFKKGTATVNIMFKEGGAHNIYVWSKSLAYV